MEREKPQTYESEQLGRAPRVILVSVLVGSAILGTLALAVGWYQTVYVILTVVGVSLASLVLGRRVHQRSVTVAAFLLIVLALCYGGFVGNGLHDLSFLFVPGMILVVSLLLEGWTFVLFVATAIAATSLVAWSRWHLGIPDPLSTNPVVELVIIVTSLIVSAIGGRVLARQLEYHLQRALENEARYRAVFENIQDVYCETLPDGTLLELSPAGAAFFGAGREEMVGRSLLPYYELPHQHTDFVATLREKHRVSNYEITFKERSGRKRDALVSASLQGRPGEAGEKIVGSIRDITDRRSLEERLAHAQRMESLGTLAGGIAHDFNNLLTVINGHCELAALELAGGERPEDDIKAIHTAGLKAAELTRKLLAFSRKQTYQPIVVDVTAMLSQLEPMIRTLTGEDIRVETSIAADVPRVLADPGQFEQVFINLLVNARDAVNDRTDRASDKSISIRASGTSNAGSRDVAVPGGRFLLLEVRDNGIGMPPDVRSRIFDPFFTTKKAGTGLGLATVFGIVSQNNGTVEVESEEASGTIFRVYWPATKSQIAEPREVRSTGSSGNEGVLLVEDDDAVRGFARTALASRGFRVQEAVNGTQALEILRERGEGIDLMVTDIVMPEMDGRELAAKARACRPGLSILFTSGYTQDRITTGDATERGVRFLAKPFSATQLAEKIRDTLDNS